MTATELNAVKDDSSDAAHEAEMGMTDRIDEAHNSDMPD